MKSLPHVSLFFKMPSSENYKGLFTRCNSYHRTTLYCVGTKDLLSELRLLLTQRYLTFRCVPCVKIKDTDDVLPIKEGRHSQNGNYSFEFCPFHAVHAWKS